MSDYKRVKGSRVANWLIAATVGVSLAGAVWAADKTGQISAITAQEQADGRTRLTIKTSAKPTFTTWKLEHPSRVVVDVSGVQLVGVDVPFDAGTFALGTVAATASGGSSEGKTRITLTLRRGADYQVEAKGNAIVVDVTPWEAPPAPVAAAGVAPEVVEAARKEAQVAAQAKADAEARAQRAEAEARRLTNDKDATAAEARRLAQTAADARAAAEARAVAAEAQLAKLAAERQSAESARQQAAEANKAKVAAEARAAKAEQEAQRLVQEQRAAESARQRAAEEARLAAVEATRTLAAQKAALDESQARAEAAQAQAERMAASLTAERAATERARKAVEAAEKAAREASRIASDGQRKDEQMAANRAAEHLARERAALQARQQKAEASEKAAALAMQRLTQEKQAVEQRQQESERARLSASDAAKRLQTDQQKALEARSEAERLRVEAAKVQQKARALLATAEVAQKQAEARQRQAEKAGQNSDLQVAAAVADARKQTEQARAAAERAQGELARLDEQRKQMAAEREKLSDQQKALAEAERQALLASKRASEISAKAADVQTAMARLEEEKQTLAKQQQALAAQQAQLALAEKATATERQALAAKAEAQQDEERRLGAFEQAMKAQKSALAQTSVEQDRQRQRLSQAEQDLVSAKAELEKREQALAVAQEQSEATAQNRKAVKTEQTQAEQAKLQAAKNQLQQALAAHAEAEKHRQTQEQKLAALAAERQSLESNRNKLQTELESLKGELASARAEVARLKAAPAPAPAPATVATKTTPSRTPVVEAQNEHRLVAASTPTPRPRSITLRVPSRISRIDFVDEPGRSSVIIDMEEPTEFSVERSTGRRVTLRLHHADLPRVLERSLDATQFFGPVRLINSFRDPGERGAVLVEVELAEMVPNRVRTDGARLYWDFDKSRPGSAAQLPPEVQALSPAKVAAFSTNTLPLLVAQERPVSSSQRAPSSKKRFTGRRIDLDFKGADIHNILRLLAEVGGVNIVTSDDVKGEVTIKMRDVPWDQALDVVLRAKTLGQIREGNLIRVAPIQVLEKELEQEIAKQKQMTEVMPTETRLIGVSYAEAKELEARAKDLLSNRGKVSVDDRTNNLIVSDVAKNLALVEELVRNLDTQTSQVIIEARIVEARSTFVRQIGVQWGGTTFMDAEHGNPTGLAFPNSIGVAGGATDQLTTSAGLVPGPRSGLPGVQSPNYAVNLPAAVGTGSGGALGLTLGSIAGALNLNLRLSALEQSGQVRILSSPRISTMDNVQASIEQGVAIPISVVSAQGVQTVFVDAKLNLTVKPHVTNEGTVILNVHVTRNEPDFVNTGARGDPTILKKEAKTVMLVRDGDTAVIGGIYQRNSGLNYAKVPFFADIPIVGFFFRTRRENDDRTEFLVFITPRIANRSRSLAQ